MTVPEIASIVAAVAASIAAVQVFVVYIQLRADHERSRRTYAIELIQFFLKQRSTDRRKGLVPNKFIQGLSSEQLAKLYARESFKVDVNWKDDLSLYFSQQGIVLPHNDGENVVLEAWHVRALAFDILEYLNELEAIATAWRHNIADKAILEEEFRPVIMVQKNKTVMEALRAESGAFPSLNAFSQVLMGKPHPDKGRIA